MSRFGTLTIVLVLTVVSAVLGLWVHWAFHLFLLVLAPLSLLGIWDVVQTKHSILRNYPLLAHFRFLFEEIRPEMHQYFIESDTDGRPYSRNQRSLIYQRAKDMSGLRPFGTELDVYSSESEWLNHSMSPRPKSEGLHRTQVGGPDCSEPYSCSMLNVSAMSFGAISPNAIRALNRGAKRGGFYHCTGEGGLSPYHLENGGDLVWQIGTGYFGCRNEDGSFAPDHFAKGAAHPSVKMIEIKLSQGAKPGHGGVLPAAKVTQEISATRLVPMGQDCISPAGHSAFDSPLGLCHFVAQLRELSGGKPIGFKLCVGHPSEFFGVCKAMLETGITPDFVTVDGSEGGTGAAPLEFSDRMGTPLKEGLLFVHNGLVGSGLRDKVKIAASGKVVTAFSIARNLALGADWCNAARAFMMSVGCIQAQRCHTNACPVGVATQDKSLQRGLHVENKSERAYHFHHNTMEALSEIVAAAGLDHANELRPHHITYRINRAESRTYAEMFDFLEPGELVAGSENERLAKLWERSSAQSFRPVHDGLVANA